MDQVPDCGERSYLGSGRLVDKRAVITGGDSGLGGAQWRLLRPGKAPTCLNEDADAAEVAKWVEHEGRKCVLMRAYFYLVKAALPHMGPGASVIGSSSVNSDMPSPQLAPYAATKAAIANFSASLAQLLGDKGIRVNSVAPGLIWTPLIPASMPPEKVKAFGDDTPAGSVRPTCRAGPGVRAAGL